MENRKKSDVRESKNRSSGVSSVISTGARLAPVDLEKDQEDSGYHRLITISYGGVSRDVSRIRVDDNFLRILFKKFPVGRAILLVAENGESIPVEEFNGLATGKTFYMAHGDPIGPSDNFEKEPLSLKKFEKQRESTDFSYDGEPDNEIRSRRSSKPLKPIFNKGRSRSRSPNVSSAARKSSRSADTPVYVPVERGQLLPSGKVEHSKPRREVRNIAITRSNFSFDYLVDCVLDAFKIPYDERHRYCLMNRIAQIMTSDAKHNDFKTWERRSSNSALFLVENEDISDGNSEDDSDHIDESPVFRRRDSSKKKAVYEWPDDLSSDTRIEKSIQQTPLNLDDFDLNDGVYENDHGPRSPEQQDSSDLAQAKENQNLGTLEQTTPPDSGQSSDSSFDDLVDQLKCMLCSNLSADPQRCPRWGHNMGGAACVKKRFDDQEKKGRKKTCPKCGAVVEKYGTHDDLAKFEKKMRDLVYFCPE